MPPGSYNPDHAGKFEAIKMPEQPKGSEKKGPNLEKLAELKAAAEARKAELQKKEAGLKTQEAPQIDAARKLAQEIAISGSPSKEAVGIVAKSLVDLSVAERKELGMRLKEKNDEMLEGRAAVDNGDTSPKPFVIPSGTSEKPRMDQNAGMYKAITPDQVAAAQRGALAPDGSIMKEVSPMSAPDDTAKMDRQPAAQPAKKKSFFSGLFG